MEEEGYILQNGVQVINKPGHKGNIFKLTPEQSDKIVTHRNCIAEVPVKHIHKHIPTSRCTLTYT